VSPKVLLSTVGYSKLSGTTATSGERITDHIEYTFLFSILGQLREVSEFILRGLISGICRSYLKRSFSGS
jgi:hypothetical protein